MEEDGRLDGWCSDNLKWLRETYGERNLVSAVLHMDEKTPHIHAHHCTDGDRGSAGKPDKTVGKNDTERTRRMLGCAPMTSWQAQAETLSVTPHAQAMSKYGFAEGVDGFAGKGTFPPRNTTRELVEQQDSLQENMETCCN